MNALHESLAAALGSDPVASSMIGGGCIHDTRCVNLADGRRVFLKSGTGTKADLLESEARSLRLLTPQIHVPRVIAEDTLADGSRWLALEWLDLVPLGSNAWEDLGHQLSRLHSTTTQRHGLDHDNYIGSAPQSNRMTDTWLDFYQECRLRPQIRMACSRGHDLNEADILKKSALLLSDHHPPPALLHGDLWAGNTAALGDQTAVVFDPAPYFGDPETDLAMLELFGGPLPEAFLMGYGPMTVDRAKRRPLYDLYHALNHLNLFGASYTSMVRRCLASF